MRCNWMSSAEEKPHQQQLWPGTCQRLFSSPDLSSAIQFTEENEMHLNAAAATAWMGR